MTQTVSPLLNKTQEAKNKALFTAVHQNNALEIKKLIEQGADINAIDERYRTALHYAAELNLVNAVQALINHGARTDIRDIDGNTALDLAHGQARKILENTAKP